LGRISKYRITRGGKFEDKIIQNNHCCIQGGQGKMQALIFLQKRQWDIENKAHHRLKESKMGRKGLGEDFKVQNNKHQGEHAQPPDKEG
jgi:hypothetical protein